MNFYFALQMIVKNPQENKLPQTHILMHTNVYLLHDICYLEFVSKSLIVRCYHHCVSPYCNSAFVV